MVAGLNIETVTLVSILLEMFQVWFLGDFAQLFRLVFGPSLLVREIL